MAVFIHDDAHFASIANSLFLQNYEDNPMGDLKPKRFADMLKRENIRSYNFSENKRKRLNPSAINIGVTLEIGELIRSINVYEQQACTREDYKDSDTAKILLETYNFLPSCLPEYFDTSTAHVNVADCLRSFAEYDEGEGLKGWHWDQDFSVFEPSSKVNPGRIKPYPWLIKNLRKSSSFALQYSDAKVREPLVLVKFLIEYDDLPEGNIPKAIHQALLKHHVLQLPEVVKVPPISIS